MVQRDQRLDVKPAEEIPIAIQQRGSDATQKKTC
jgi:hypothetical protein